jgi:RNA polymerase sigma-70 factor (ECF subfamily)
VINHDESSVTDMALLGQLFDEHRERLLSMLRRRIDPALAARIDAEDVLSETFLQGQRRWKAFRGRADAKPYPWLYRIALDCLIEAWRRETRQRRDPRAELPWPEHSSVQIGLGLVHRGTSPTQAAGRAELRRRMKQVLDLLPGKDRDILRMRHEDGLSHADTGEVLGITENAATVRYVRALQRLKDLWQQIHSGSSV